MSTSVGTVASISIDRRSPVEVAKELVLEMLPDEEDGNLRTATLQKMDAESGFAQFFSTFMDQHTRLKAAKPVLIQEHLSDSPWQVLLATCLLNKTSGRFAIPVVLEILDRWPTPRALSKACPIMLEEILRPLGLQSVRCDRLIEFSKQYRKYPPETAMPLISRYFGQVSSRTVVKHMRVQKMAQERQKINKYPVRTLVSHLPGTGQYALDSYRIFCCGGDTWREVRPKDKELVRYLQWRWAMDGRQWSPQTGEVGPTTEAYLEALIEELVVTDPYKNWHYGP